MSNNLDDQLAALSREELLALPTVANLFDTVREFSISAVPEKYRNESDASSWAVQVVWRSEGKWAVMIHGSQINADGDEGYESLPSSRTDDFKKKFRFDLPTALAIAEKAAKEISVNSLTVDGFVKWNQAQEILDEHKSEGNLTGDTTELFHEILESLNPDEKLQKRIDLEREYKRNNS